MKNVKLIIVAAMLLLPLVSSAQMLYRISSKDTQHISYIFGSNHLCDISFVDNIEGFYDAFDSCSTLYGEMLLDSVSLAHTIEKSQVMMMLPADTTLRDIMREEDYTFVDGEIKRYFGQQVSLCHLSMIKPAAISTQLAALISAKALGKHLDASFVGMDSALQQLARKRGMTVLGLESDDAQLALLYGDSLSVQVQNLVNTLRNTELEEEARGLNEFYTNCDSEGLFEYLQQNVAKSTKSDEAYRDMMERMIYSRNRNWMEIIPTAFATSPTFIVVGAGHLHGEHGLITLLEGMGYSVDAL